MQKGSSSLREGQNVKLDQLDASQQQIRQQFLARVRAAGWDVEGWERLADGGADVSPEAHAELEQRGQLIRLSGFFDRDDVVFEIGDGSRALSIHIDGVAALPIIAADVIAVQETLSLATVQTLLAKFTSDYERVYVETPRGLQRLTNSRKDS